MATSTTAPFSAPTARPATAPYWQTRWLALGAVAGPVLFTLAWLILGFLSPGYTIFGTLIAPYSPIAQPISGLGLGLTGPFMDAAFVISGILLLGVQGWRALSDDFRIFALNIRRCSIPIWDILWAQPKSSGTNVTLRAATGTRTSFQETLMPFGSVHPRCFPIKCAPAMSLNHVHHTPASAKQSVLGASFPRETWGRW